MNYPLLSGGKRTFWHLLGIHGGFFPQNAFRAKVEDTPIDADLQADIEAWGGLPEAIRAGIVAMVRAAGAEG